jgi:hypothetical protein
MPGGLSGLEMRHVGHEPDRVLDQAEAAVLSVEASVQLGKFITHPGAEPSTWAVGICGGSMLVMASTPTAERG